LLIKIAIIIAILIIPFFLKGKVKYQEEQLVKLKEAKQLIAKIPEFEKKVKLLEQRTKNIKTKSEDKKQELVLNGIFIQDNKPVALISQNICFENDPVEGFTVIKINTNSVVLKNSITQEEKTLSFPE